MRSIPTLSHSPRFLRLLICLVMGCCCAAFTWLLTSAAGLEYWAYLPWVAKPVPSPTPTSTATPLPRLLDVRVEGPCCNVRGGSAQDPSGEWVCFRNYDSQHADLTNWRVQDASGHTYTFPVFVLSPGMMVRLHSGPGTDTTTDLYWGRGLVWNNDHDIVYLYDAFGRLVSRYVY